MVLMYFLVAGGSHAEMHDVLQNACADEGGVN
jgi:hypothetical protein